MPKIRSKRPEGHIQAVDRAAALLRALGNGADELGVTELSHRLAVHKSTASRLLSTLERHRLVEKNPLTDKYRLGPEISRLAESRLQRTDLISLARPTLVELAETTNETVNLAVLDGEQVMNIDQVTSSHVVNIVNWTGRRTPAHCVSNGKVLLAHLPDEQLARVIQAGLPRLTERTLTRPADLRAELAAIRRRGYATAEGEFEEGMNAVSAPVRNQRGEVVAAVTVSGPVYRLPRTRLTELAQSLMAAAEAISRRLGYKEA